MKIYIEGSIEEINEFLYGDGIETGEANEETGDKDECDGEMSPDPNARLKLRLIHAFADTLDDVINDKP